MVCDPSLWKLDYNLSFPYGYRLIPEKKFLPLIFRPRFFFLPGFFSGANFEFLNIFEIRLRFFSVIKNKPGQQRCPGLFLRTEKNLSLIWKIFRDSKSAPEKKAGEKKKTWGEKWGVKTFFLGSAYNHGGMIDYSLTFTKRGHKPYLSLIGKEL